MFMIGKWQSQEEAIEFIYELIENQILTPELNQSVTGDDLLCRIIELLEKIEYSGFEFNLLIEINKLLKRLDTNTSENNLPVYNEIIEHIKKLNVDFEEKYLLTLTFSPPQKS